MTARADGGLPEGVGGPGVGSVLDAAAEPRKAIDDLAVIAMADGFDGRGAAAEHVREGLGGEVGIVLEVEVRRAPAVQGTIDARHLEIGEQGEAQVGGGERYALQEAERVGEVFEHVAADRQIGAQIADVNGGVEQLAPQLYRPLALAGAVRVEADIAAARPRPGQHRQKAAVAVTDFDDRRALGQAGEDLVADRAHEPRPQAAAVEHQVGHLGIGDGAVVEGGVVNVAALDAAHEIEPVARQGGGLGAVGPGQGGERLLAAVEERHAHVMTAGRTGAFARLSLLSGARLAAHGRISFSRAIAA